MQVSEGRFCFLCTTIEQFVLVKFLLKVVLVEQLIMRTAMKEGFRIFLEFSQKTFCNEYVSCKFIDLWITRSFLFDLWFIPFFILHVTNITNIHTINLQRLIRKTYKNHTRGNNKLLIVSIRFNNGILTFLYFLYFIKVMNFN